MRVLFSKSLFSSIFFFTIFDLLSKFMDSVLNFLKVGVQYLSFGIVPEGHHPKKTPTKNTQFYRLPIMQLTFIRASQAGKQTYLSKSAFEVGMYKAYDFDTRHQLFCPMFCKIYATKSLQKGGGFG